MTIWPNPPHMTVLRLFEQTLFLSVIWYLKFPYEVGTSGQKRYVEEAQMQDG